MRVTGLFRFRMKVSGVEQTAIVEITAPGIPSYDIVRVVRGEWANRFAPGISQNRIECLGREAIEAVPGEWKAINISSPYPVRLFQQIRIQGKIASFTG